MVDDGEEVPWLGADLLVLAEGELDGLVALDRAARSDEADEIRRRVGPQAFAQLPDPFVDFPEDSLVLRHAFSRRRHTPSIGGSGAKGKG